MFIFFISNSISGEMRERTLVNTKQLFFLLLSIVSLHHSSVSACLCCIGQENNPLAEQAILTSFISSDFYNIYNKDLSLAMRPTKPEDMETSGVEIYDTENNNTLLTIADIKEAIKIYGIIRNNPKTILVTFMVNAKKFDMNKATSTITTKVWDITSGACLLTVPHAWLGSFNHKGDKILLCSKNKAQVWDIKTQKYNLTLPCKGECYAEFSKQDDKILIQAKDVKIWDTQTGKCITTIKHHDKFNSIDTARFDATGNKIITTGLGADKQEKMWDVQSGKLIK